MATPKINTVSILVKANKAVKSKRVDAEVKVKLQERGLATAIEIRKELESAFDNHPVTQELKGNSRETGFFGYGNFKAYFGLNDTKVNNELQILKGLLGSFKLTVNKDNASGRFRIIIKFPEVEDFYAVTPPPEGAYRVSWLKALEKGLLQNFSKFLFRQRGFPTANSRSTTGIQTKNSITALSTVPGVPYITDIYKRVLLNTDAISGKIVQNIIKKFKK